MIKVPSIRGSAQARLLLYRLMSLKLSDTEQHLLSADLARWDEILAQIEKRISIEAERKADQAVLSEAFKAIERSTAAGLKSQMKRLTGDDLWLGIKPTALLDNFVGEHTKLIKSVSSEHLDKIGLAIERGIREGRLGKDITKEIQAVTGMCKRRAQLIARAGPLQYSGALTQHHQTSAGIKSYIWQSSRDDRVRDFHRKLDGEIFNWDGPGPHPRSEVNCRCDAVPVVDY